jgi:hypothetical protein
MILDGVPPGSAPRSRHLPEPFDFCPFSPAMEKVLAVGAATTRLRALKTDTEEAELPQASIAPAGGNAICPVLFLEMLDFSRKPVADQLVLRERFNGRLARALEQISLLDRMVLDTGEGVAITFLGGPEVALHVALRFAHSLQPASGTADPLQVRAGINFGPVRVTRDAAGNALVLGDGINVAQRLLGFATPGQFLVSRAYHEVLCQRFPAHRGLFLYQGSRTDTHVREHEVYELDAQAAAPADVPPPVTRSMPAPAAPGAGESDSASGRSRLALASAALSAVLLLAAVLVRLWSMGDAEPAGARSGTAKAPLDRPLVLRQTPILPGPAAADLPAAQEEAIPMAAADAPGTDIPASGATARTDDSRTSGPDASQRAPALSVASSSAAPRTAAKAQPARRAGEASPKRPVLPAASIEPVQAARPAADSKPSAAPTQAGSSPQPTQDGSPWPVAAPAIQLPPTPAAAKKAPTALVLLAISPWGEVFVDGKSVGVSPPLTELELPQGKHRIVVRNSDFKPFDEEIELGSNQTLRIKHKFARRS